MATNVRLPVKATQLFVQLPLAPTHSITKEFFKLGTTLRSAQAGHLDRAAAAAHVDHVRTDLQREAKKWASKWWLPATAAERAATELDAILADVVAELMR